MATFFSTLSDLPTPLLSIVVGLVALVILPYAGVRIYLFYRAGMVALDPADPASGERAQRVLELNMGRRSFGRRK